MKQTINVTARDIKYGTQFNGRHCPIARAVVRTKAMKKYFPDEWWSVGKFEINFPWTSRVSIPLPDEAVTFIKAYDNGEPVEPFSFTVEVPE